MGQTPTRATSPSIYYHAKVKYASDRISILGVYDNITEANQCARQCFGSLGSPISQGSTKSETEGEAVNSKGCIKHSPLGESCGSLGGQIVKTWVERGPAPVSAGKRMRETERERGEGE
jgi:hypothetical protein